jgi:hypothetical protein
MHFSSRQMALVSLLHRYTYSFTDPLSEQVGLNMEFALPSPVKIIVLFTLILSQTPEKWNLEWQAAYKMPSQELNFLCTGKQEVQRIGLSLNFYPTTNVNVSYNLCYIQW